MTVTLHPRGYLREDNHRTGLRVEMDTHTCVHCQRVVLHHPERTRPRNVCRKCMALTCDAAGCVLECRPIKADLERAYRDLDGQPWLLRDGRGEPIDRIWAADGTSTLVLRRDNGMTERERRRLRRPADEGRA